MKRQKSGREEGAILVEMAFVLPIIALVFVIIIDGGLAVREHQLLQNAAREAARIGSLPPAGASDAAIQQIAVDYCAEENIPVNLTDVTVAPHLIPLGGGLYAEGKMVTISYAKQMLILGAPLLPSNTITLTGRAVFQNLY